MLILRYSRGNCFTSWGIATCTNWHFSHVDILRRDGRLIGANITPGVDLAGNAIKSGTAIREPGYDDPVREVYVEYPDLPDITEDADGQIGQPFDWSYIFGILGVGKHWGQADGFACIELCEWLLMEHGASLLHQNYDPWRMTPAMGMASPYGRWEKSDVIYRPENAGFWCSAKPIAW